MEQRAGMSRLVSALVVLALAAGVGVATACLWWLGDWEDHAWGLTLTVRILWGCWTVVAVAIFLTHVTIFGWSFRRYLRWDEPGRPPTLPRRPTTAPWFKSPAASFSITVVLVSLTGAAALASSVMWVLKDVTGEEVFRLVFKIIGISWWVGAVATVLTRIAIFGLQKRRVVAARRAQPAPNPAEKTSEAKL